MLFLMLDFTMKPGTQKLGLDFKVYMTFIPDSASSISHEASYKSKSFWETSFMRIFRGGSSITSSTILIFLEKMKNFPLLSCSIKR